MSSHDLYNRIYDIVRLIPSGRVTTYGTIAACIGMRSSARMVGWALNALAGTSSLADIPAHRVVNRNGMLSGRMFFDTPFLMREMLEAEGIEFDGDAVRLDKHMWVPEIPE